MIVLKKFEDILLESLALYTKKKVNILVKLQNLNNYKQLSYSQIKNCKTVFKQLKNLFEILFLKKLSTFYLLVFLKENRQNY